MTTMINRKPPMSTGGPNHKPIVTVSMYAPANDDVSALEIEHVEIIPTKDELDAHKVYKAVVDNVTAGFAKEGVEPVYVPLRPGVAHRMVTFTNAAGTRVSVEKF